MSWTGIGMALGIVLMVIGGLGIVAGVAIAVVGPGVVEDAAPPEDDGGGFFGMGSDGDAEREREMAEVRQEVRAVGAIVAGAGAAGFLLGGILYAIARGVESSNRTRVRDDAGPPRPH